MGSDIPREHFAKLLAEIVTPFLDDAKPVMAPGFLPEQGEAPGGRTGPNK